MKRLFSVFIPIVVFFFSALPSHAVYFGSGENLSLSKTQKFAESVFVSGQSVTVDSDINGDLYCAGQNITVNGKITGDVLCAGQSLKINGQVDGNIRFIGQQIEVNGLVSRNIIALGQTFTLGKDSSVKGDLLYGVQSLNVNGMIGRDLTGGSQSITLSDSGKVGRNLEYYIEKTGTVSINEKSIRGKITRHELDTQEKYQVKREIKKITPMLIVLKATLSILSSILVALFLLYFTASRVASVTHIIKNSPVKSALVGLAVLITGPLAIIISFATVVGALLGVILLIFYLLSLILAFSYTAVRVGQMLGDRFHNLKASAYLSAALGSLLLGVIVYIPFVGWLVAFIAFLIGLGASFLSYLPSEK